jgi:hypothetical protein
MSRHHGQTRRASRSAALILCACGLFAASLAHAALGDSTGLLPAAATVVLNGAAYERSYTDAGGTTIHEYASAGGQVFAYTWNGPTAPDLHTILGGRLAAFRSASAQSRAMHGDLHAQHVASADAIVESGGAMRGYLGRAWLPGLMPGGVSISDLQ